MAGWPTRSSSSPPGTRSRTSPRYSTSFVPGFRDADVLVVDDGSTDGTAAVAREHGAEVLSFGENRGLQEGIAAGYAYANEHGYELVGRVDADGQHPVDELARLLEVVRSGEADVAVGSRFASGDGYEPYRYEPSPARRFGTAVLRRSYARGARPPVPRRDERDVCGQPRRAAGSRQARTRAARPRSSRSSDSARPASASSRFRWTCGSARAASRSSAAARRFGSC